MTGSAAQLALAAALAAMCFNAVVFIAFGIDKLKAEAGKRRIRESTLLGLALIGGTPGAYAARALFRHKTRKQPFSRQLHAIALVQLAALAGAGAWLLAG